MKALTKRAMKYILFLPITVVMMSCESSSSNDRYESLAKEGMIAVIDKKTSEVFVYTPYTDSWHSIGKPSETPYTRATRPKDKVDY